MRDPGYKWERTNSQLNQNDPQDSEENNKDKINS